MEMHNANERGNGQHYMIPESSQLIANPQFEQVENMYPEGAPEFVVDQGVYYPTATNYGFYCTGFGAPSEWEDHHRIFGVDGPDVQFTQGVQTENLPYVYYTPSYGYAEASYNPYNPYNPYIPGAMIGVDNPFVGPQQYYAVPPYQNSVSSSGYIPIIVPSDATSPEAFLNTGTTNIRSEGRGSKSNYTSQSGAFARNSSKTSNHANLNRISDGAKETGLGKPYGGPIATSTSRAFQGRSASSSVQHVNSNFTGKVPSHRNQFKVSYSEFGSSGHGWVSSEKTRPKFHLGGLQDNVNGPNDSFGEQNRGPRTNRPKSQLAVKAYTNKAGNVNAQGIIVIDTDHYNKDDFPLDYEDGKFFVIKSYSEDDVHKSVKYNVWSSTPHGNKKLQSAYEEAQKSAARKPRGCPIFLFFSVNASGQFCGVAEMIGPVDYHKDMDFWQQDKWSGSFPVKWHFIKDVQNTAFRHIILENNENKPVTNSRDTQEIFYKQGMDMLKIFKNHTLKTSILDDFMYYENRQKIMMEERARVMTRSFQSPFSVPAVDPPRKMLNFINEPSFQGAISNLRDPNSVKKDSTTNNEPVDLRAKEKSPGLTSPEEGKDGMTSVLKIGTLTINPKNEDGSDKVPSRTFATKVDMEQSDVVTVGSVPVKVNGLNETSNSLIVGTIPLDPRAHDSDREGAASRGGAPRN